MFWTLRSNLWYFRCIKELLKMLCCCDGCFRLKLMVRANISFAKESILMDYFVVLIDLAKSNGNFISVNYPTHPDTPITLFRKWLYLNNFLNFNQLVKCSVCLCVFVYSFSRVWPFNSWECAGRYYNNETFNFGFTDIVEQPGYYTINYYMF